MEHDAVHRWRLEIASGVSYFSTSQSNVPLHLLKPMVRVETTWRTHGLDFGVEFAAAASSEAGYRLVGVFALVKAPLWEGPIFDLALVAGVGAGSSPRILHHDLAAEQAATLWVKAGLDFRWWLPGNVALGIDLESEHITTATLSGTVTFRF